MLTHETLNNALTLVPQPDASGGGPISLDLLFSNVKHEEPYGALLERSALNPFVTPEDQRQAWEPDADDEYRDGER